MTYHFGTALRKKAKQKGQALLWFLATAATTTGILVAVYNVGQLTSEKQKIVNAADAAAYSGALTEARVLNLTAYTNRTIIANEVFTAQLVSLDSWTTYVYRTAQNFTYVARGLSWIPGVAAVAQVMQQLSTAAKEVADFVDQAVPTAVQVSDAASKNWLSLFNTYAFTPPTMALAARNVAQSVLTANATNFGGRADTAPQLVSTTPIEVLTFAKNQSDWGRLTKKYSGNERTNARDIILRSRDDFSAYRPGHLMFSTWDIFKIGGAEKKGPTTLQGFDRWVAQDTFEFWIFRLFRSNTYLPVGWGRAANPTKGNMSPRPRTVDRYAYLDQSSVWYGGNHTSSGWEGIKEHFDVERYTSGANNGRSRFDQNVIDSGRPGQPIDYMIVVAKPGVEIPTNEKFGFADKNIPSNLGSVGVQKNLNKSEMATIAKAKIFFERPARNNADFTGTGLFRADNAREISSLYNPYWQVRLDGVTAEERSAVYLAMGMGANAGLSAFTQ
jgi:Putative Flp pilus-assembly TadE/G-like